MGLSRKDLWGLSFLMVSIPMTYQDASKGFWECFISRNTDSLYGMGWHEERMMLRADPWAQRYRGWIHGHRVCSAQRVILRLSYLMHFALLDFKISWDQWPPSSFNFLLFKPVPPFYFGGILLVFQFHRPTDGEECYPRMGQRQTLIHIQFRWLDLGLLRWWSSDDIFSLNWCCNGWTFMDLRMAQMHFFLEGRHESLGPEGRGWIVSIQRWYQVLIPGTYKFCLIRKQIFVDVIKNLDTERLSWINWIASNSSCKCPYKRKAEGKYNQKKKAIWSQRQGLEWCSHRSRKIYNNPVPFKNQIDHRKWWWMTLGGSLNCSCHSNIMFLQW